MHVAATTLTNNAPTNVAPRSSSLHEPAAASSLQAAVMHRMETDGRIRLAGGPADAVFSHYILPGPSDTLPHPYQRY